MTDLDTMHMRDSSVFKVDWQPPLKVGSVATMTFNQLGKRTARYEVLELETNRKLRVVVTIMGTMLNGIYEMEPVEEDKTRFHVSVQIRLGGLLRILSPFLSYKARRDGRSEIARIKHILEEK